MPSSILAADLDAIFADPFFTSAVVFGAQSTRGMLEHSDFIKQDGAGFDVQVKMWVLSIRTGTLTNLAPGSTIVVDGTTYTIHDVSKHQVRSQFSPMDDGQITEVVLAT